MNIAYCISAYKDAAQLGRLMDSLDGKDVSFVVHVDRKVGDIGAFRDVIAAHSNAVMCPERLYVQWGGWSQVLYQELFLRYGVAIGADRIVILSGQDYPLWSNRRIRAFFEGDNDRIMMCGLNLTRLQEPYPPMRKLLAIRHIGRDWHIRSAIFRRYVLAFMRLSMRLLPYRRKPYVTVDGTRWNVWQSSGYFSVNVEQAKYINSKLQNRQIRNYFRYCFVPEELAVPTIIFNSPFKQHADVSKADHYEGIAALASMHYFYYPGAVKILGDRDYNALMSSNKMFARKMSTGKSDNLMRLIDENRRLDDAESAIGNS